MRPRLDCRGEPGPRPPAPGCRWHFNAATARLPWRTLGPRTVYPLSSPLQCGHGSIAVENNAGHAFWSSPEVGFNAATARLPWRTRLPPVLLAQRLLPASMRPRLDCRGERQHRRCPPAGAGRFNAATARLPWRTRWASCASCVSIQLQCGHGSIAVENVVCGVRALVVVKASMRPRLDCRGELWRRAILHCGLYRLQCGHGSIAVENQRTELGLWLRYRVLQCGHGSIAVENSTCLAQCGQVSPGFNAATARLPWRTLLHVARSHLRDCSFNAATARLPWRTTPAAGRL